MRIRRFTARDMGAALQAVRGALGPDAVILETRTMKGRDGTQRGVVVLAAADRHSETQDDFPVQAGLTETAPPQARERSGLATHATETQRLRRQLRVLRGLVASDHFSRLPAAHRELYLDLIAGEVDANLALGLLRRSLSCAGAPSSRRSDLAALRQQLRDVLPQCDERPVDQPWRIAVLAGPAGAGKTTVAAALAARALRRGLHPGLISLDTFRAGGASALRQYALSLEVPFATAFTPDDLAEGVRARLAGCDTLLIDTPALTRDADEVLGHLQRFQRVLSSPQLHWVLPAHARARDLLRALPGLEQCEPRSIIFTHLDETDAFGGILSLSLKTRLPVSFLNWGRDILRDLRECTSEEIVARVLARLRIAGGAGIHEQGDERLTGAGAQRAARAVPRTARYGRVQ